MGRVRCNYCGSFIDDALPNCPHCGAVNEHMVRFSEQTPKTIAELQEWYRARNLPPEDVTRFYIGKDVKQARAFGIYEKDGKFIVYKNKSDGSRAVRYEGQDEAYAVNEIYMKLKEEILNQKNRNLTRAQGSRTVRTPQKKYQDRWSVDSLMKKIWRIFIVILLLGFLSSLFQEEPLSGGYYTKGDPRSTYYLYEGAGREWWKYDSEDTDWGYYEAYQEDVLPEGIEKKDRLDYEEAAEKLGSRFLECTASLNFIDRHHPTARQGYYIIDNSLYYFLDNIYGSNSGWYTYDDGSWDYYASGKDKDGLGEALWYDADSYYSAPDYHGLSADEDYYFEDSETWDADFSDTSYYESYQQDLSDFNASQEYSNDSDSGSDWDWSSWDNDCSWDWDSGSDWDSGWSDWDSDW